MKQIGLLSRLLVAAAVGALVLAVPIGVIAHEHSDHAESQCRICKVSGAETVVVHDDPALPAPERDAGLRTHGVPCVLDPPATGSAAPRAPPS